ncbi:hypothetical protein SCUP234_12022 [Seiridium cupressi]
MSIHNHFLAILHSTNPANAVLGQAGRLDALRETLTVLALTDKDIKIRHDVVRPVTSCAVPAPPSCRYGPMQAMRLSPVRIWFQPGAATLQNPI